jgi:hypothetical protein
MRPWREIQQFLDEAVMAESKELNYSARERKRNFKATNSRLPGLAQFCAYLERCPRRQGRSRDYCGGAGFVIVLINSHLMSIIE